MRKVLKWVGFVLGGLVGLIVLAVVVIFAVTGARFNKSYDVQPASITIPTDEASISEGEHLATSVRDCTGCHGADLSGTVMADDPAFGYLAATNLTAGQGGAGSTYTDEDWVRAIRHGVGPDSKPLIFMPSHELAAMSAEDTAEIIAYIKSVPPVDQEWDEPQAGPLVRILFITGQFPAVPAELIDHSAPPPSAPEPGVTVEYGEYLGLTCEGCHGLTLSGGPIPGAPPEMPPAANITPHQTGLADWTEEDFFQAMREGVRPDGSDIDPFMPYEAFSGMTDDEISALWFYLQSVEPQEFGNR
jgi:mono/diheme cytochrome c family protein